MATKNPEHKGKIPWVTAERNLGREAALQLVDKGKVAPPPDQQKYGAAQPFVEDAKSYLDEVTGQMNKAGVPGHLTVMLRQPEKEKGPKPASEKPATKKTQSKK